MKYEKAIQRYFKQLEIRGNFIEVMNCHWQHDLEYELVKVEKIKFSNQRKITNNNSRLIINSYSFLWIVF